jgi:hypothetical protein
MVVKGKDAPGVKTSKERVTVLVAVSAAGEKLKPLMIGRSAKPRCFQGIDLDAMGIEYYHDKRQVNILTSVHSAETFRKEVRSKKHDGNVRIVDKPCCVQTYSQHMGGVDRADKQLTCYMMTHRSAKWWKKVFFYLLVQCLGDLESTTKEAHQCGKIPHADCPWTVGGLPVWCVTQERQANTKSTRQTCDG